MNEPMSRETESVEQAVGKGQEAPLPLLRVYLFGEFQLAWQVPSGMGEAAWNSRTSARALFKLLLCAPGRQATKSALAGILWPETDEQKARESLRTATRAMALKSKKRFEEAVTIYQRDVPEQWHHETAIKQMVEQFQLPTGAE